MIIGTHDGKFHADEVFAIAILRQIYPNSTIVRSRNTTKLGQCDLVVDVGGGKYDHHTVDKIYRENGTPYASAGLIWRDYGKSVVERLGAIKTTEIQQLMQTIDEKLIQGIDAIDNGVNLDRDARIRAIPEIIGGFNPNWNESLDIDDRFMKAVEIAELILVNQINLELARLAAVERVVQAFGERTHKELLIFDTFFPWMETLLNIDTQSEVLFVIFPDKSLGYRLQVVPKMMGSFEARKPLPAAWAGLENSALDAVTGITDSIFCHPARFIAGAGSMESILKLAHLAITTPTS